MADTSELVAVERVVQRLKKNVSDELENTLEQNQLGAVKTVETNAKRLIDSKSDVGKLGQKPDQQSLYNSFGSYVTKNTTSEGISGKLVVGSTAPHAAALNEGTDPHKIFPNEEPRLIFEGAPGDSYSAGAEKIETVETGGGYRGGDLVTMKEGFPVEHPGVSETSYFELSLIKIRKDISNDLDKNIRKAILESGFKPSTN